MSQAGCIVIFVQRVYPQKACRQEAISNAVRHAKPTVVSVTLRWEPSHLILKAKDSGSGISSASLDKSEGFGLRNMRTRASQSTAY
jgi:signal transduction histidine kinase